MTPQLRPVVIQRLFLALAISLAITPFVPAAAPDHTLAVKLAREYLESSKRTTRERVAKELITFNGDIDAVLSELNTRSYERVKTGYLPERHFSVDALRERHPDDLLYFNVPKTYRADRPTGLIIFLHGGGPTSSRRAPRLSLNFPDTDVREEDSFQLGNLFEATGMIAVGPSAPWNENSSCRWCLEESDEYLADVIAECESRFNIDPDRVILLGHSMGGFGAYHHAQRQPDRFAAVIVTSGSYKLAYWPVVRSTPLCIVQGTHDAVKGKRWHYTDVAFARTTDKLLTEFGLDHVYLEHDGNHGLNYSKTSLAKYLHTAERLRRDPYAPHITLATPLGYSRNYLFPVKHNRWLTLVEQGDGSITYDELHSNGSEDFDEWKLSHVRTKLPGAVIGAVNKGNNTIEVTTKNVVRFTVWLHPRMIDVNRRVKVVVDDKTLFSDLVRPSLLTVLESYERRNDWGLVYPMKIHIAIK